MDFSSLDPKEMEDALNMMNVSPQEKKDMLAYANSKEAQDYLKNINPKEMEEFMKNDTEAQAFMKNSNMGMGDIFKKPKAKKAKVSKPAAPKEIQEMDDDFYQPREDLLQMQNMQVSQHIKREIENIQKVFNYQEDEESTKNLCTKDINKLKSIKLKHLKPGEIQPDTIVWLTVISDAAATSSVNFIVEDEANTAMICNLYNLMPKDSKLDDIQTTIPVGLKFGLKQPYMKMAMIGMTLSGSIRNDNPENLIQEFKQELDSAALKEEGNKCFKTGDFSNALLLYTNAFRRATDQKVQIAILSNMAQCYINLEKYEDALSISNQILTIDPKHMKTLFRKGKSLCRLHKFQKSLEIFKHIKAKEEIENLRLLENLFSGDLDEFLKDPKPVLSKGIFQNFIDDKLFIKKNEKEVIGLHAIRDIGSGEFLIVEKAFESEFKNSIEESKENLVQKCQQIAKIGNHFSVRLGLMMIKDDQVCKELPAIEIFNQSIYKKYGKKEISEQFVRDIVNHNVYEQINDVESKIEETEDANKVQETKKEDEADQDQTKAEEAQESDAEAKKSIDENKPEEAQAKVVKAESPQAKAEDKEESSYKTFILPLISLIQKSETPNVAVSDLCEGIDSATVWMIQASKDIKSGEVLQIGQPPEFVTEKERQLRQTKFKMKQLFKNRSK